MDRDVSEIIQGSNLVMEENRDLLGGLPAKSLFLPKGATELSG